MYNQSEKIKFSQQVPVRRSVDVLVAGGGPAGVAAAVSAARAGADVLVVDCAPCFGGLGTMGLVPSFIHMTNGVHFLAGGIGQEVLERMNVKKHPSIRREAIQVEALKRAYDEMVEQSGADFLFETRLIGVGCDNARVTHAYFAGKSELFAIEANVFIDATGDGLLSYMAGAECQKGDEQGDTMPSTLCALWTGVEWERVDEPGNSHLERAYKDGVLKTLDLHHTGAYKVGMHTAGTNIGHIYGADGTDEGSLTSALVRGRRLMPEYERYYREYLHGYENMEPVFTNSLGIRETRRVTGDYVLCLDDYRRRAVFADEIGRYSYPVDIHPMKMSRESFEEFKAEFHGMRYKPGETYGIPYRALIVRGLSNVLTAGRCISTDRYMQSSVRVMPCCFITGQAAGIAASQAQGGDVRGVDTAILRAGLRAIGAFLPEYEDS